MDDAHGTTEAYEPLKLESTTPPRQSGSIRKIWKGEHPLWFTVWVLGVVAALGMMLFWSSLGIAITTPDSPLKYLKEWLGTRTWMLITGPLSGLCGVYLLIVLIGTWRSASRYQGWRGWRWLAWLFVIISLYFVARLMFMVLGSFLVAMLS